MRFPNVIGMRRLVRIQIAEVVNIRTIQIPSVEKVAVDIGAVNVGVAYCCGHDLLPQVVVCCWRGCAVNFFLPHPAGYGGRPRSMEGFVGVAFYSKQLSTNLKIKSWRLLH